MLSVAGGSVDISPTGSVPMGCGPDPRATAVCRDPIEANALLVSSEDNAVLLISVDCLYPGPALRKRIEEELHDSLAPAQIFLAGSHTHFAPMLDPTKPDLGEVDPDHLDATALRIAGLCRGLLNSHQTLVRMGSTHYETKAAVGRRRRRPVTGAEGRLRFNSVAMAPSELKHPNTANLITFTDGAGQVKGVIWQLPCHPTAAPSAGGHTAEFPGQVRQRFRRQIGANVPFVFLQGFSGDLRPPSVATPRGARDWVRRVVLGRWFEPFNQVEYDTWVAALYSEFEEALANARPDETHAVVAQRVEGPLSRLATERSSSERTVSWHRVSLGKHDIVGVSAEPVSEYAHWLEQHSPNRCIVPVGCIDDAYGYLPTQRMLKEGGYEADRFLPHFGLQGLNPNLEALAKRQLGALLADS